MVYKVQVILRLQRGTQHSMSVPYTLKSTVASVKTKVGARYKVAPSQLKLLWKGTRMGDNRTLASYGVHKAKGSPTIYAIRDPNAKNSSAKSSKLQRLRNPASSR